MFCVFIPLTYQGVAGITNGNVEKSDEISKTDDDLSSTEMGLDAAGRNQSEPEGPPDSHEAMNNRELKPKLTIGNRRKRSYEFLVGLVKRNASVYEVTKNGKTTPATDADVKASEVLLELLVKIAANPQQWSRVHALLQKIDNDLIKSKELVDNIKTSPIVRDDVAKTKQLVDDDITSLQQETTKYPWLPATKTNHIPAPYQKNFAYHRVTGNPLTHAPSSGSNKNPKAYIAVSVIAPKATHGQIDPAAAEADDLMLENELKELKPWSHQQNLKNMADIRSRWVIQTDKEALSSP